MSRNYDFIVRLAATFSPPPAAFLDFGAGAGEVVRRASELGYAARGVDVSPHEGVSGIDIYGKSNDLPYASGSFDVIVSNQVLEHVSNLERAVSELQRVLRPGGHLILMMPTAECWIEPHIGTPFVHLISPGPWRNRAIRAAALLGLRRDHQLDRAEWVTSTHEMLRSLVFYRTAADYQRGFAPLQLIASREPEWARDRLPTCWGRDCQ